MSERLPTTPIDDQQYADLLNRVQWVQDAEGLWRVLLLFMTEREAEAILLGEAGLRVLDGPIRQIYVGDEAQAVDEASVTVVTPLYLTNATRKHLRAAMKQP